MVPRFGILCASVLLFVEACGGPDDFRVAGSAGGSNSAGDGDVEPNPEPGVGGTAPFPGSVGGTGTGGDADGASGGARGSEKWVGTRIGPTLDKSPSPELGGMNSDLESPMRCESLPVGGCMHFSGMWDEVEIEGSCVPSSFDSDEGFMTCAGEGFSFGANLPGFTGPAPSTFDILVFDMSVPNIGFQWDAAAFMSHGADHQYLLAESYELQTRASGAVYELVQEDETRVSFVEMIYSVTYTPRPTCGGCSKIRLLGYFSAPIGE